MRQLLQTKICHYFSGGVKLTKCVSVCEIYKRSTITCKMQTINIFMEIYTHTYSVIV